MATTSTPISTRAASQAEPRLVARFNRTERAVHWLHGCAFVVALVSGLALYFPVAEELIGHRFVVRVLHISSGLAFVIVPLLVARLGNWAAVKADFHQAQWWDDEDRRFFASRLTGEAAHSGRFNAGQKANMMFTVAATLFFLITGVILWQYFRFDSDTVKNASLIHDSLTFAILVVWLGHLWYSLGNPRTRHSIRGMLFGEVDREWAARQHPRWLEEMKADAEPRGRV